MGLQRDLAPDELVRANARLKQELEAQEEQARATRRKLIAEAEEADDRAREAHAQMKRTEEAAKEEARALQKRLEEEEAARQKLQAEIAELKAKINTGEHARFSAASA